MREQRKGHEVENGRHHIISMDHTAQGGLAGSQSQASEDRLLQRETIYCKPSAHTNSG